MTNDNFHNLLFFENTSMKGLYQDLQNWQEADQKRLFSLQIAQDGDMSSCIALTNPSEVIICHGGYGAFGTRASVVKGAFKTS